MDKFPAAGAGALPASRFATNGVRGAIDSLVQGSLVELFDAYNVAVAPMPRSSGDRLSGVPDVTAAVALTLQAPITKVGRLTLSMPSALLDHMKSSEAHSVRLDWARELTNQLAGRIKNRLLPFGVKLEVGTLSLIEAQLFEQQQRFGADTRVYAGRTLRGEVVVTLSGMPAEYELSYVGAKSAAEGSIIWF